MHVLLHAGACNDAQFACFARAVRGTRERYCIGASDKDIFNSKGITVKGITVKACLLMYVFSLNSHLE